MEKTYSIIDIETTGGYRSGNKITEIAILNFNGSEVVGQFSTLINPEISIPYGITRLTGINNEMVRDAPKFYEVAKKIVEMTEGNIFVAHNVFFDFNFIKHEFRELGYSFNRDKLCTVRLARQFLPGHESYSLGNICNDLGINITARHRALGDALATVELLKLILSKNEFGKEQFVESKKLNIPKDLDRSVYESLPEKPGVYYFYSKEGGLLYIGKSKNIKKRVASHFRPDMKRKKDIALKNAVANIEFKLMGSELAALLFENSQIAQLRPPYNVALKSSYFPINVILCEKSNPFELKRTTLKNDDTGLCSFKNKNNSQGFINNIYKSFLNTGQDSIDFETKKSQFLNKFGEELYNNLLKQNFNRLIPKKSSFILQLAGRKRGESCHLMVEDYVPKRLVFDSSETEMIDLHSTPQMQRMLFSYIRALDLREARL